MKTARDITATLARAEHCAERDAWILHYGSEHMKLALELGYADASEKIYVEERLRHERGIGWSIPDSRVEIKAARNPDLDALRALKDARSKWSEAIEIGYVKCPEWDGLVLFDQPAWSKWTVYFVLED